VQTPLPSIHKRKIKKAAEIMLPNATLKKLNEIFPEPGGKAPKAYA
jgi:hypothetical protein